MLWVSTIASLIPPLPAAEDAGEDAQVGARLSSLLSLLTSFPHPRPSPASPSGTLHLPGPDHGLHLSPSLEAYTLFLETLPGRMAAWATPLPTAILSPNPKGWEHPEEDLARVALPRILVE